MSTDNPQIQIIDIDYFVDKNSNSPIIRIFGKDTDGKSVCCFVPGFEPYFYVQADSPLELCTHLTETFDQVLKADVVQKYLPIGYQTETIPVVKVTTKLPTDVRDIRDSIQELPGVKEIFEADILFHNRYLIDKNLHPMKWISVTPVPKKQEIKSDWIMCEYSITASDVRETDRLVHAPLKHLAWDIECLPVDGQMPTPDISPVIMISLAFSPAYNGVETLVLTSKQIPDVESDILCFDDEPDMLNAFFDTIRDYDPDVITGFNSDGFDTKYVVDRCKSLSEKAKVSFDTRIGRDGRNFNYRVFGQNTLVAVPGRIVADVLPIIRSNYKLKRYNLETVAKELLGKEKLDVLPSEMEKYWNDPVKVHEFLDYSRRDSELAIDLLLSLKLLDQYIALAQASGRPIQDVISGGQTNLVEQLLMARFLENDRLMSMKPSDDEVARRNAKSDELEGAHVLSPDKGLHSNVIVLDYKSLYPTIMMARNLCYTTVVMDDSVSEDQINITPSGGKFIKPEIYKGIIPAILEELLDRRVETKNLMKETTDENEKRVLDATQLALKILLNSFYGYSGYTRARLYSLVMANSVTSYGRTNIHESIDVICRETGSLVLRDNKILTPMEVETTSSDDKLILLSAIYGDTDSLFIHCTDIENNELEEDDFTLELSAQVGDKLANIATDRLPSPMQLEYEATAKRILLVAKKRYAMWQFERTKDGWNDKIKIKGLETVRRDWCNLTSNTQKAILDILLKEGNVDKCVTYMQDTLDNLKKINDTRDSEVLSELVLSKKLSRSPSNYVNKPAHVGVYEKIKLRNGTLPAIGERIPYYITENGTSLLEKAEDASFVIENNINIDVDYYVNKQMIPPVLRLLESFNITESMINVDKSQTGLFDFGTPESPKESTKTLSSSSSSKEEKAKQPEEAGKTKTQQSLFDY